MGFELDFEIKTGFRYANSKVNSCLAEAVVEQRLGERRIKDTIRK